MDEIVSRPFLLTFHKNNAIFNLKSVKKAHWDEHREPSPVHSSPVHSTSIQPFTGGLRVRNWLAGQSYEYQYEFGLNVIKMFS